MGIGGRGDGAHQPGAGEPLVKEGLTGGHPGPLQEEEEEDTSVAHPKGHQHGQGGEGAVPGEPGHQQVEAPGGPEEHGEEGGIAQGGLVPPGNLPIGGGQLEPGRRGQSMK